MRLGGPSAGRLVRRPRSGRASQSRLPRTVSRGLLCISRDGDSAVSLGDLCPCWATLTVPKCSLVFRQHLLCCSLCPLPPGTTGKVE